jgi:glycosyltransferase involved in cell wall biosynthesis
MIQCSIVMASYGHAELLRNTLVSIFAQQPKFEFEVIVVDDGSLDDTPDVLAEFLSVRWTRLVRKERPTNPAHARNVGYRMARGEVIICQSDEVLHESPDVIQMLVEAISPGTFVIAGVKADDAAAVHGWYSHSIYRPAPYLFLGAVYRADLYSVGGNDERFIEPAYDDDWFGDCLIHGLGLHKVHRDDIIGHHQSHGRSKYGSCEPSRLLYEQLRRDGRFYTEDAPWPL